MKKQILSLVLLAATLLVQSCNLNARINASGDKEFAEAEAAGLLIERTYTSAALTEVEVTSFADVTFHQIAEGQEARVVVRASQEAWDKNVVRMEHGEFYFGPEKNSNTNINSKSAIDIYVADLREFENTGVGRVDFGDFRASGALTIKSTGTADIYAGRLTAASLEVKMRGTGDFTVARLTTGDLSIESRGTGDCHLAGTCRDADIDVEGTGDVYISQLTVRGERRIKLDGTGSVR